MKERVSPRRCLPRIFELYFTTKPKGSGIGLAMTYRILQMHGGAHGGPLECRIRCALIEERLLRCGCRLAHGAAAEIRKSRGGDGSAHSAVGRARLMQYGSNVEKDS